MKYNILLAGHNESMIDNFFTKLTDAFEAVTTSTRFADIINHVASFRPDVFAYCLDNEPQEEMKRIANLQYRLSRAQIPIVVIGLKEDCDKFEKISADAASLILRYPLSEAVVREKIITLVKDQRFMHAIDEIGEENAAKIRAEAETVVEQPAKPKAGVTGIRPLGQGTGAAASHTAGQGAGTAGGQSTGQGAGTTGGQGTGQRTAFAGGQPTGQQFAASAGQSAAQNAVPGAAAQKRKHVLVVDDNAMMLKMIKEHLHDQYDVATAASGRIALKFLERKKTDLILLDYEMPEESGPVVLEQLRASETTKNIPVIFLTGVTETEKIMEALALKPQNYLLKPVDREKLLEAINATIG